MGRSGCRDIRVSRNHVRMNAGYADLGYLEEGTRVMVDISGPANVRLITPECAVLRQFVYGYVSYGGAYPAGTITLTVPESDHWLHVVDLEGFYGRVSVSPVRVEHPRRRVRSLLSV
jgi:hypothetical protein